MVTPPIRLAAVRYLNAAPLIEGLDACADLELVRAVPARIAGLLASGDADLGLVSVIDAARADPPLAFMPHAGMIGCDGPTLTVRVFSRVEPARITTLHADTESHTSVALAQVILARSFGVRATIVDFHAHEFDSGAPDADWPEAVLLIGDKVVAASPPAVRYPHQLDLGQAWRDLTGLPFVYAIWACAASRAADERVRLGADLIDHQRRRNESRLDHVVTHAARDKGWPGDLAREYVGHLLHYEVGPREREAVATFLTYAAELGLAPARAPIWADQPRAAV
ncbi:MAG: menaquinone biosynthesis protein [Phycisphaerales bacterium]